jgi:hypothetical protein
MRIPRGYRLATPVEVYGLRWGQLVDVLDTHDGSASRGVVTSDLRADLASAPVEIRLCSGGAFVQCWGIPIPIVDQFQVLVQVIDIALDSEINAA